MEQCYICMEEVSTTSQIITIHERIRHEDIFIFARWTCDHSGFVHTTCAAKWFKCQRNAKRKMACPLCCAPLDFNETPASPRRQQQFINDHIEEVPNEEIAIQEGTIGHRPLNYSAIRKIVFASILFVLFMSTVAFMA